MRRSVRNLGFWTIVAATTGLLVAPVEAQVSGRQTQGRTRVEGKVTDADGNPVAGVELRLVNQQTSAKNTKIKSKKNGNFSHPLVEFGPYKIYFEKEGYRLISYKLENRDSAQTDMGSFGPLRFGLAEGAQERVLNLRPSGVVKMEVIMVPAADYEDLALAAAGGQGPLAEGMEEEVQRTRHPAEVGAELYDLKNYEGALEQFLEAKEMQGGSEDPNLFYAMGRCQYELGQYPAASASFSRVAEMEKEPRPGLLYYLALIADKQGRKQEAIDYMEREVANAEEPNAGILSTLGSLYRDIGETDKAITTLERAVATDPGNLNALLTLGTLYDANGEKAKAEASFQRAVEAGASAGQSGAVVFFNLGALNYNQGELRTAAEAYERAVAIKPKYAAAHRELGYTYRELGEGPKARQHFETYLKLQPKASDKQQITALISVLPSS